MRKLFAVPGIAAVATVALTVTGCGGLDTKDLQNKLGDSIAKQVGVKADSLTVKCPDASGDKGEKFTCTVTDGKETRNVAVTVTNDDGHVDWKLK